MKNSAKDVLRLDKFISNQLNLSRKQAKDVIQGGLVSIDGSPETKPEAKVNPDTMQVEYRGQMLTRKGYSYYMLHKPAGVVSATKDNVSKTVLELLPEELRKDLFPVGRLDKDTEGLLFLTDDGPLSHALLSPKRHVPKKYYVETKEELRTTDVEQFANGLDIGEKRLTKPAKLDITDAHQAYVTISEGKFHQVKRMFEKIENKVVYLKRVEMAGIKLDDSLDKGQYRPLSEEEIQWLRKSITQ